MTEWDRRGVPGDDVGRPADLDDADPRDVEFRPDDGLAPSDAFQTLANDVRLRVLVHLFHAEREGGRPCSFSELQTAAESESSAGFAYHLRQLSGHFVERTGEGYVLTPAGRRAARAVLDGTFTNGTDATRAS